MKQQPLDVIVAGPRTISSGAAWLTAVALLAAALAGAIVMAVHYREDVAALHRQLRSVPASPPHSGVPLTLSSGTVALPAYRSLNGEVTVFSARYPGRPEQIVLSARISGGRPHTGYALIGFDCAGSSVGYETWGVGVTGADGSGTLSGKALTVSLRDDYWLYLSLPSRSPGPGLLGSFTATGQFSATPAGDPAC